MTNEQKEKIEKIYALANLGLTEGERKAAKLALDRILKKYNLDESVLNGIELKQYTFKYTKIIERWLLERIMYLFVPGSIESSAIKSWSKEIVSKLNYLDWVTINSCYEYFRRHMRMEYNRIVLPELKKHKKAKTKSKRRSELQELFFNRYVIASKLYKKEEISSIDLSKMTEKELLDRQKMANVNGGKYNKQVISGNLLNA